MASNIKKWAAEFIGTFWLDFRRLRQRGAGGGVSHGHRPAGRRSFAFGLTVLTGAYALGPISGGHFNPAVCGPDGRRSLPGVRAARLHHCPGAGAIAAGALYVIATGKPGADIGGFATNGFGEHSPGGYSMMAALVAGGS